MRKSNTIIQAIKRARKAEDGAPGMDIIIVFISKENV